MKRIEAQEPDWIHGLPAEPEPEFRLYVVFNGMVSTRMAMETASRLARGLRGRLVLLAAKVVPYPLPLESPPVSPTYTDSLLRQLAAAPNANATVRVYLCRDRDETIRNVLEPGSLVVIGCPSRWRLRMPALARLLQRDGHQVVVAGLGAKVESKPLTI